MLSWLYVVCCVGPVIVHNQTVKLSWMWLSEQAFHTGGIYSLLEGCLAPQIPELELTGATEQVEGWMASWVMQAHWEGGGTFYIEELLYTCCTDKASHLTAFCAWDSSPHLLLTLVQLMHEAWYWPKCILHSGWLCRLAFFIQGDVDIHWLFMHIL